MFALTHGVNWSIMDQGFELSLYHTQSPSVCSVVMETKAHEALSTVGKKKVQIQGSIAFSCAFNRITRSSRALHIWLCSIVQHLL